MELDEMLRELIREWKRVKRTIVRLEAQQRESEAQTKIRRRGRKSMGPEERLEVSERMKQYWRARRAKQDPSQPQEPPPGNETNSCPCE